MTPRRRFCPKGHDTFEVGRDSSYRCRRCKLDAKAASRRRASDARRREAEAIAAERAADVAAQEKAAREQEARREREAQRRREAERQKILDAGGEEALDLLQGEAFEAGRCGWYEDGDTEVCLRPTDESFVWCKKHNRQLERQSAERRRQREAAEPDPPQMVQL